MAEGGYQQNPRILRGSTLPYPHKRSFENFGALSYNIESPYLEYPTWPFSLIKIGIVGKVDAKVDGNIDGKMEQRSVGARVDFDCSSAMMG